MLEKQLCFLLYLQQFLLYLVVEIPEADTRGVM